VDGTDSVNVYKRVQIMDKELTRHIVLLKWVKQSLNLMEQQLPGDLRNVWRTFQWHLIRYINYKSACMV